MLIVACVFTASLVASLALTPVARRLARKFDIVDRPDGKRKLQANAVPLLGGVALYAAMAFGLVVASILAGADSGSFSAVAWLLVGCGGFVCLVGCIDDRFELKPRHKLLLQIIATLPIVVSGHAIERTTLLGVPLELGWVGIPLTVLWLVACINALNLLDGMDGLASIVGLSTCAMIALIAMDSAHAHVPLMAVCLAGALVGFLCYNLPPASIYLGDSGSMVIGLVVGVLAMQGAMKSTATLSLIVPVVIMTVPLLDTALAVVRRKLSGSSFDVADRGHIHHCLLRRGLSVWQSLWIISSLCLASGAAAAASSILRVEAVAWIAVVAVVSILIRTRAFGYHELSLVKLASANLLARVARRLAESTGMQPTGAPLDTKSQSFDTAWQALIAEAERLDATALELRRARASGSQLLFHWSRDESTAKPRPGWQYTLRTEAAPGATIELQASGTNGTAAQGWNQLQLNRLLGRFHHDWAAQAVVLAEEGALARQGIHVMQASESVRTRLQEAA